MNAIKRLVEADALKMEIIPNPKVHLSLALEVLCTKMLIYLFIFYNFYFSHVMAT